MSNPSEELLVIIPTYGHFDYAELAIESLLLTTPEAAVLIVDDGSKDWTTKGAPMVSRLARRFSGRDIVSFDLGENRGVTRMWNIGLEEARNHEFKYACTTNSDVVFAHDWWPRLKNGIEKFGYDLVGPVSNTPGPTARGEQEVGRWLPGGYDKPDGGYEAVRLVSLGLEHYRELEPFDVGTKGLGVNGFCMAAKTESWWKAAYDKTHVFNPGHRYRMTLSEDELHKRWRAKGMKIGIVPSSFVFHWRSVTRGDKYKKGLWARR